MEGAIVKAIELVLKYTVAPIARQLKYACCYKSCVAEMNEAIVRLQNEKEVVDVKKSEAENGGKLIHKKADDWLEAVTNTQEEVGSLGTYEESKAKMSSCSIGGQILNPVSRHKLGRRATKKKLAIEGLCQTRPQLDEISYDPPPSGIVDHKATASATAKQKTDDGVFRSSEWDHTMEKIMTSLTNDRFSVIGLHGEQDMSMNRDSDFISNPLIGVERKVEEVENLLQVGVSDVRTVGIYGTGGIGKTSLAKLVFDRISTHFEGCSFLQGTRETIQQFGGLEILQRKLMSEILRRECVEIGSSDEGICYIREVLSDMRVLIVLDNVGSGFRLDRFVGDVDSFGPGSRIIVIARSKTDLPKCTETYEVLKMNDQEAFTLFATHAFKGSTSSCRVNLCDVNHVLCQKILSAIGRIPLAIEVIGSLLSEKPVDEWGSTLDKSTDSPDEELQRRLKLSYDALSDQQKKLFLDVACFINGEDSRISSVMWRESEGDTVLSEGLKGLVSLSLVKIGDNNELLMHDELRELGRELVYQEELSGTEKMNRFLIQVRDFAALLAEKDLGRVEALSLFFDKRSQYQDSDFRKIPSLRFLKVADANMCGDFSDVFTNLRWLHWEGCPRTLKATNFYLKSLVILNLSRSKVTSMWEGWNQIKATNSLKVLNLTGCMNLITTPNLSNFPNLERLILEQCSSLVCIDPSIQCLEKLQFLNLKFCTELNVLPKELGSLKALTEILIDGTSIRDIPISIGHLVSLETLSASSCVSLTHLPSSISYLTSLSELTLDGAQLHELPDLIGELKILRKLSLKDCRWMQKLPDSIRKLKDSLIQLDVSGTGVSEFSNSIQDLQRLKVLRMNSCFIRVFPKAICYLSNLEELHASHCRSLESDVPSEIESLRSLKILRLGFSRISSLPLSIFNLPRLQNLDLDHCNMLSMLPRLPSSLSRLCFNSRRMVKFPDLPHNLEELILADSVSEELLIPKTDFWIRGLPKLKAMELRHSGIHSILSGEDCSLLRKLTVSCPSLKFFTPGPLPLLTLSIHHCRSLEILEARYFQCLVELQVLDSAVRHISGLGSLKALRVLKVSKCQVEGLDGLEMLSSLVSLTVSHCEYLLELPNLSRLVCLRSLVVSYCDSLESLSNLSELEMLKQVEIHCCKKLSEIHGSEDLKSLEKLQVTEYESANLQKKDATASVVAVDAAATDAASASAASFAVAAAKQQTEEGVFRSSQWEDIMEKIMTALQDNSTNVIGLHGMGGVGKSTMINEVYDQVKRQGMFDEVVRVEVKVEPEIRRIQRDIAFQLGLKFDSEWSSDVRRDQLRERLLRKKDGKNDTEQTKKKTVLIILDDLWKKLDLEYEVGIPLGGNDHVKIKLLLTSREEYLLSDKMGARELIHLNVLSDADALRMFMFVVGLGAEGVKDDLVTEVARKCSGLPIVIEATAKALKDRALDEWEKILKRLDNVDVLEKLKVSYDYLPSKESKDLFLICGISRGPSIQVRDLLKYTFGLRLYNRKDSSTLLVAAAKLEELLSRLEAASMLLKSDDHRYVKIHDRMRELAVKIVEEDRPEWAYDVTLSDNSCELPNASELKLLLSCCKGDVVELRDSFLKDMEKLNVLEFTSLCVALSMSPPTDLPDHLRNLTTLCFDSCSLDDISMIGELKGLQILSFRGSDIRKLPIQLRGLIALKMLDLSNCVKLTLIEPDILGSLTKLEELNMENSFKDWEIEGGDDAPSTNARLSELKNMTRLSNVRIHIPRTSMLTKDGQLFSSKLTMYQIIFGVARKDDYRGESVEDSDFYHKFSDEYSRFSRVLMLTFDSPDILRQDWVQTTLQTAEVLYLSGRLDEKCESIGEICINGFDCLKHLRMRDCPSFRFIVSSNDDSSTNLESLSLEKLENLETLCGGLPRHEEAFNKLRVVKVKDCSKLTHFFDFSVLKSRLSSQLKEISVERCREMQCIVVGGGDNNCDVVRLSNLQKLKFEYLPKFSSFCAGPSSNVLFSGKKVAFPCLESLEIWVLDELENIWHPTDPPAELGSLRSLDVRKCNKLELVSNSNVFMMLQRDLESLYIFECGLMKQVFDVDDGIISSTEDDVSYSYSSLKQVDIRYCPELRTFCEYPCSQQDSVADHDLRPFFSQKEIFPCLESLYLEGLSDKLGEIWPDEVPPQTSFNMLKQVEICRCSALSVLFPSALIPRLENLTDISVRECGEMRQIIMNVGSNSKTVEEEEEEAASMATMEMTMFTFPRLTKLFLYNLPKLERWFYSSSSSSSASTSACGFQFPCLESLQVRECGGVQTLFSGQRQLRPTEDLVDGGVDHDSEDMVGSLFTSCDTLAICPNLKSMYLDDLTKIWKGEKPEEGLILKLQSLTFSFCTCSCTELQSLIPVGVATYLTELTVLDSHGLKYVFTPVGAASLVHLTHLTIHFCTNIKEVIVGDVEEEEEGVGAAASNEEENKGGLIISNHITFTHLKVLKLEYLDSLEKFSSVKKMVLNFPSLEDLDIKGCPKMTAFSSGAATASTPKFGGDLNSFVQKNLHKYRDF